MLGLSSAGLAGQNSEIQLTSSATGSEAEPAAAAAEAAAGPVAAELVGPPGPASPPERAAKAEGAAPLPYAEPISPDTARRYPHLAGYEGHILIGGGTLQLVLAGVPALPVVAAGASGGPAWQAGVLAVFERRPPAPGWARKGTLAGLDLRAGSAGSEGFVPVAVDLGSDREQGAAYASFIYTQVSAGTSHGNGKVAARLLVTWRLDDGLGRLAVSFDDFPTDGASAPEAARPVAWPLRLRGAAVAVVPPETAGAGRGVPYLLRGNGGDVTALLGYRAFAAHERGDTLEVTPVLGGQRPPVEGYELLLTRTSAASALGRVANLKDCLYGVQRPRKALKDEAKLPWLLGCDGETPKTTLRLTLPAADAGGAEVAQPVYLVGESGRPLLYAAVVAGETLEVAVPPGVALALADTPFGRALDHGEAQATAAGAQRDVTLPARRAGHLRLVAPGGAGGPALVSVSRFDGGDAAVLPPADGVGGPALLALAPHTWLVRRWPVDLALLPGAYGVRVVRGREGRVCQLEAVVRAGRRALLACGDTAPKVEHSPLKGNAYADLAWRPASPPHAIDVGEAAAYAAAIGVDVVARAALERDDPSGPTTVPVLDVDDPGAAVSLAFVPATRELAARWASVRSEQPADVLGRFTQFLRDEGAHGVLELGCPGAGADLADYQRLLARLRPDAARLFGCRPELGEAMMALWGRVAAAQPLKLTAVSFTEAPEGGLFFPRLALTTTVAGGGGASAVVRELEAGSYGLSAGATLLLKALRPLPAPAAPPARPGQRKGRNAAAPARAGGVEAVLIVAAAAGVEPRELAIYTEKGLIRRVVVPPRAAPAGPAPPAAAASEGGQAAPTLAGAAPLVAGPPAAGRAAPSAFPPTRIRVPLPTLHEARWIRIELRGSAPTLRPTRHLPQPPADALLAATNYLNVQGLYAQSAQSPQSAADKESH